MIHITIICDALCVDLIKFVLNLRKENIFTNYILVAPFCEMHSKRKQQTNIRRKVLKRKFLNFNNLRLLLSKILKILKVKNILVEYIFIILSKFLNFNTYFLDINWSLNCLKPFRNITVVYSLEGILSDEIIKKFANGIVNIHPAKLPDYRGLDASIWSLIDQKALGVTAYQIDKGVDTGKVIMFFPLEKRKFSSISEYTSALKILKYKSYADSIKLFYENKFIDKNPLIEKNQNRGLIPYKRMLEIENNFKQVIKF